MKVKIIRGNCIGCGACQAIAPNVFELDDEGISKIIGNKVSEDNEEECKEAIDSCPTGAIIEE